MSLQYPSLQSHNDANDWSYVGEGNQNIVVRYVGSNPVFRRKVLRIVKTHQNADEPIEDANVLFRLQFVEEVIEPLIGKEYITRMIPVKTTEAFLSTVAQNIQRHRPAHRLKGQVMIGAQISFLMQDLTQLWFTSSPTAAMDTITFELKPKWGFKPSASNIDEIKKVYCRFCMHAHMRSLDVHDYCPLDLYSNDRNRMKKALNSLLHHPALSKKTLRVTPQWSNSWKDKEQDILLEILIKEPILTRLQSIQKNLDSMDIENIMKIYEPGITTANDINVWKKVIAAYFDEQKIENCMKQRIYEYVLSMTFKDCSIMINAAPTTQSEIEKQKDLKYVRLVSGSLFKYDIKVIDIDLKKTEKIPYWYELDKSIVKYAKDTKFVKNKACQ